MEWKEFRNFGNVREEKLFKRRHHDGGHPGLNAFVSVFPTGTVDGLLLVIVG